MKREILIKNAAVTLAALLIFAVLSMFIMDYHTMQNSKDDLERLTYTYKNHLVYNGDYGDFTDIGEELKKSIRITVIADDGTVLGDSYTEPALMDNHLNRPEVQAALNNNPKTDVRNSDTFGIDMLYYAEKVYNEDNTDFVILRVAKKKESINSYIYSTIPVLTLLIISVVAFSVLFTLALNKSILSAFNFVENNLNKISEGRYENIMPNLKHAELNSAVVKLNDIQQKINDSIEVLSSQTEKLDFVLENIKQGIIALDGNMNIVLINTFAKDIFDVKKDITGQNILYSGCGKQFYQSIEKAHRDDGGIFETNRKEKKYTVTVSVKNKGLIESIIILSDVTAIKRMENTRSDFFANASHELKTPITSITGFSELMENEKNPQNIQKYARYIIKDSKRMLRLIDDMLKLSKLDSMTQSSTREKLSVSDIAKEVKDNLSIMAAEKDISININGDAYIYAVKENIYELIENLVTNAIRYNNKGGKVNIDISQNGGTKIIVEDNGIGIAQEHHDRIFERFYRVDKGRSKAEGGTGLGLSIVKHIVSLYGGELLLESNVGKGTKITIKF
ncbi:MAG: ATP-binding protein [Clostridia bacterium]|nr:ATP-binding protein [Clostridia bacterium]